MFKKYVCGWDTFIRHASLADLSRRFNPQKILDVGGEGYSRLFFTAPVISVNVHAADVRYAGSALPFKDKSFDLVISCDTLEHLPKIARMSFCEELMRVCRKGVVLCAPFGTPEHIAEERKSADDGRIPETVRRYLREHICYGLPTADEIAEFRDWFHANVHFQGDFRDVKGIRTNGWISFPALMWIILKNFLADMFWAQEKHLTSVCGPYTNRFFLVIEKSNC